MKKPNSPTAAQKLAGAVEQARARLTAAETTVQTAKQESRAAKQKRKQAKEAVRRTKKRLKQAKEKLGEAKRALAEAEDNFTSNAERAAKAKKRVDAPRPPKSPAAITAKKNSGRAASRERRPRPLLTGAAPQQEFPHAPSPEPANATPSETTPDSTGA